MTDLPLGSSIAGLRIEAIAGRGGMGVVYRALDNGLNRQVAVKVIAADLAAEPEFRERFRREARTAASVNHPNVIPVFGTGEDRGLLYLTMQYADGTDLRELIRLHGRLDVDVAASIVNQVAAALDAAHRRDLVHRDVKPANILVTTENGAPHVYLTDFGLTRSARTTDQITRTGLVVGTAEYMAPELFDEHPATVASDVYALGCLLYQTLSGELPFKRTDSMALIAAHMTATPPSLGDAVPDPDLRAALDAVIAKAMAKSPENRQTTAGELGTAVAAAVHRRHQQASAAPNTPAPSATTYFPPAPVTVVPAPSAPQVAGPRYAAPTVWPSLAGPATPTPPPASGPRWVRPPEAIPVYAPVPQPVVPEPEPPLPQRDNSRRPWILAAVGALVVLVVAIMIVAPHLFATGTPESSDPSAGPASPTPNSPIVLAKPVDTGEAVQLSWTGPANLEYGIDVAADGVPAQTLLAHRTTSYAVVVRPGVPYCFQVRGTDGQQVFLSNIQPLRGAACSL